MSFKEFLNDGSMNERDKFKPGDWVMFNLQQRYTGFCKKISGLF